MDRDPIRRRLAVLRALPPAHPFNRSRHARAVELAAWLAFDSAAYARLRGRAHVLALGDSHMAALPGVTVPGAWVRPFALGGATASGILNPASRTRARQLFDARLAAAPRWQHVLLGLGEVDCGFVVWQRARSHGLAVEDQLQATLDSYRSFIEAVRAAGFRSVSVLAATLPTVPSYGAVRGNPSMAARRSVTASLAERTALTRRYNAGLAVRCERLGVPFFDTTAAQVDPATGAVRRELVVADDPHLELAGYAAILGRALCGPAAPWRAQP